MVDVSAAVFIFIIALAGVALFLLGIRIGQKGNLDALRPLDIPFRSRQDFVNRVARPMVDANGDEGEEERIMKLYNQASPYFICTSMVMMDNAVMELKAKVDYLESPW